MDSFFAVKEVSLLDQGSLGKDSVYQVKQVIHMEVGWFDVPGHSSGAIGARLSADAATVRGLVGDALGQMVENISSAVVGLVIAFVSSWQLAFIILVLIPLIGVNGYVQVKFMKDDV